MLNVKNCDSVPLYLEYRASSKDKWEDSPPDQPIAAGDTTQANAPVGSQVRLVDNLSNPKIITNTYTVTDADGDQNACLKREGFLRRYWWEILVALAILAVVLGVVFYMNKNKILGNM